MPRDWENVLVITVPGCTRFCFHIFFLVTVRAEEYYQYTGDFIITEFIIAGFLCK